MVVDFERVWFGNEVILSSEVSTYTLKTFMYFSILVMCLCDIGCICPVKFLSDAYSQAFLMVPDYSRGLTF